MMGFNEWKTKVQERIDHETQVIPVPHDLILILNVDVF